MLSKKGKFNGPISFFMKLEEISFSQVLVLKILGFFPSKYHFSFNSCWNFLTVVILRDVTWGQNEGICYFKTGTPESAGSYELDLSAMVTVNLASLDLMLI
ncbi:MAG: hypothetical protein CM15mP107_4910 [Bacteroidota bacterium]|nr:MAG: hypothetical protein CM15mP107_4910 [Bacteroidota bacterium]